MASPPSLRPPASAYDSPTFGEDSSFHVEQPVGSMTISPCGRDVVLASKEGLHIIDLDSPYAPPRYLPHHTPWEVADVQWSPFAVRDSWVVSTSNQKALVWNLSMNSCQNSIEHVLHAHSRAITDINWSAFHPDVLATCAVDSFVHCWDLRIPAKPVISFSDWFAGATQVKWNRQDPHVIASSHDKLLRIWDDRKGAYPIRTIEAHDTKIYGVDWNRVRPGALVTCSLDKTIKFWDYTNPEDVPEKTIHTPFPVWRARHTPFGWGVLAMPQRGNSDLHLYSRRSLDEESIDQKLLLAHSFPGHKGQVKEFLWRPRGTIVDGVDHREFQLVSWGTDRELRLHRVTPEVLKGVGYEEGKSFNPTLNLTRKGAIYKTFRDDPQEQIYGDVLESEYGSTAPRLSEHFQPQPNIGIDMSNVMMPHSRGWTQGDNISSRVGMHGRSTLHQDMNPIAWMRGVKIAGWDVETLGDEITHVGEKFTKVAFESIDVRQRKVTISMHGPWGPDMATLFLKVDIKFPADYPRAAIPVFNLQKTSAVTDELCNNITSELRTISETYMSRKQGCLEGVLRYLLGERNLEESVAWALGEAGIKSPVDEILNDEESSDEDEEVGQFQGQDLSLSSSELLRPVNANVMVPIAKACGATWAHDGRLVCFFPPKKEATSFFSSMGLNEVTRLSRTDKVFEGFGRLHTSSPGPKTTGGTGTGTGTGTFVDDGTSDYSDDSSASSSSSGSTDLLTNLPVRFPAPQTWRSGSLGFHRSRSTDNSQKSGVGTGSFRPANEPQNIISIHEFDDLLPARRELAEEYRIFGTGSEVCRHNAAVAAKFGNQDLAQVWGLVELILHNQLPSDITPQTDVVAAAGQALRSMKRKDSGIDLSEDDMGIAQASNSFYKNGIRWGEHPLGGHWFVPALFEYFERLCDVQMLAMLSCVFYEPNIRNEIARQEKAPDLRSSQKIENPSLAVDYTSLPASQNRSQAVTPLSSTFREAQTAPTSGRSSLELWQGESPPIHSTGTTPPLASKINRSSLERRSQTQHLSISESPDQGGHSRSASNLGTALASSFTRSFTFGPSTSSASPPTHSFKKKPGTGGGSITPISTGGWTTSTIFNKSTNAVPDHVLSSTAATSQTHSESGSERHQPLRSAVKVKVKLKNQALFDNSGSVPVSFLDPAKDWLYFAYRAAYAEQLFIWGLPVEQSEVRKIDRIADEYNFWRGGQARRSGLRDYSARHGHTRQRASVSHSLRIEQEELQRNGSLDFRKHCVTCGASLSTSVFSVSRPEMTITNKGVPNVMPHKCANCKEALAQSIPCVVCLEVVEGMFAPCLNCGHVVCFQCHRQWFASEDPSEEPNEPSDRKGDHGIRQCASGCGCSCSDYGTIDMPMPPPPAIDSDSNSGVSRSSSRRASRAYQRDISPSEMFGSGQHEDELDAWRNAPIASLARGLGGGLSRGLPNKETARKYTASGAGVGRKTGLDRMETI